MVGKALSVGIAHAASSPNARDNPSVNGEVPVPAMFGASDPASVGLDSTDATVADGVNPETGGLSESTTDLSPVTYGPNTDLTRTYDSLLAQEETTAGTPGLFGYGWSSSVNPSLSFGQALPGWLYTIGGTGTGGNGGDGGPAITADLHYPVGVALDSQGDVYVVDNYNHRVRMIAAGYTTPLIASTTPGDIYNVAGSSTGAKGSCSNGSSATTSTGCLSNPYAVVVDSHGDVIIANTSDNTVDLVSARTAPNALPFYSGAVTKGDIYHIAGTGSQGAPTNSVTTTSSELSKPEGVALDDSGNLYISSSASNQVVLVAAGRAPHSWALRQPTTSI